MKENDNISIKVYYNRYCKILSKVITAAKKMAYDNFIKESHNKMNSTWKIINTETGRTTKRDDIQYLIDKSHDQNVAEIINEYFLSIANKLSNSVNSSQCNSSDIDYLSFMEQAIKTNYPKICNKPSTTKEIEKIIYSFRTKDSCGYDQISLEGFKTEYTLHKFTFKLYL
jgi:hypothetical protein